MKKKEEGTPTSVRFTSEDLFILAKLEKKLGIGRTAIVKLALRRLAEAEKTLPKV